jgi:hypothetical protein
LANDAYSSLAGGFIEGGVVYTFSAADDAGSHRVVGSPLANPVVAAVLNAFDRLAGYQKLFPGESVELTKQPSFLTSSVHADVDVIGTETWASIETLVGQLIDSLGADGEALANVYNSLTTLEGCASSSGESGVGCVKKILEEAIGLALQHAPASSKTARILGSVQKVFWAVSAGEILGSATSAFIAALKSPLAGTNAYFTDVPTRPTLDGKGRVALDACLSHDSYQWSINMSCQDAAYASSQPATAGSDGSYIARNPDNAKAVLVKGNGTVWNIDSGSVFDCLSATMVVWDNKDEPALSVRQSGTATCADAGPTQWVVKPADKGGNVPNNAILREYYKDAGANPQATWLINRAGAIQSIPDGGVYLCLAYANPVIWDVRYSDVQAWTPVGTSQASCG